MGRSAKVWLVVLIALPVIGAAAPAMGSGIAIAVAAPKTATVGEDVQVRALVTSAGEPVAGAVVALAYDTTFGGVDGHVELDRATTGRDGIAVFDYVQRAVENTGLCVEYLGPDDVSVEPYDFTIAVQGAAQQHRSDSGVSIWWLNGWWLIVIILIFWALIVFSATQLVIVGRKADEETRAVARAFTDEGTAWISGLLTAVTILTAIGMAVVFVRNPLTHANLDSPAGYRRTDVAFFDAEFDFLGPGLDAPATAGSDGNPAAEGRLLFFGAGCASCHGLDGAGAFVGPDLGEEADSVERFISEVRKGPGEMPSYRANVLTDSQLERIASFLQGGN